MIPVPVLTAIATEAGKILGDVIGAEINKQMFVRTEVKRLKVNYDQITAMIKKAEQTATVLDDETNHWMKRIKDHMYDVDDVVDTWMINDEKNKVVQAVCEAGSLQSFCCCKNVFLKSKIYTAIKVLNEDFDQILKLPLGKMPDDRIILSYGKTAPDYNADIMGDYVAKDCDAIINLLKDQQAHIIAIVGMVGSGKTTLARKIYHSVSTGEHEAFHIKIWIRFTKDLTSLIMWSDTREENVTKAQLQQLGIKIAKRKFLLVIDDVWTENVWEAMLEGPLQQGKYGSKVIFTTRHKHVAKRIGASHIHYVKRMNDVDAWKLLCQRASVNQSDEIELRDIGQKIVRKCDGLPLAIRSIGRTLRGREPTRHDWENACRTAFQDLSPEEQYMINLSFQDLQSYMRRCFLYCSIFPEGWVIEKRYITQHWISEGFIERKRKSTLEEIAEDCFDELIGRGLLQLESGFHGQARATMPTIICSFARILSDHENFCNELSSADNLLEPRRVCSVEDTEANNQDISNVENHENYSMSAIQVDGTAWINDGNIARLDESVENNENNQNVVVENDASNGRVPTLNGTVRNNEPNNNIDEAISNGANNSNSMNPPYRLGIMTRLRTLILCNRKLPEGFLSHIFKRLTLLRVLDLHNTDIKDVPDTIDRLEHLRYLNISDTLIKKIPKTIRSLKMLRYLYLKNCNLKELTSGIWLLQNLRSIDISGTGLDNVSWNFNNMEELSSIHGFYLRSDGVQEQLNQTFPSKLKSIQIMNLEKVEELPDGNKLPLMKLQLKDLELCYTSNNNPCIPGAKLEKSMKVLESLCPHKSLVSLKIENYCGILYPSWISRSALRNLQQLQLQNCLMCEKLPTLSDLPQLKFLAITGFDRLSTLGVELCSDQMVAFPKLEDLRINNMNVLHTLLDIEGQHLPCLQRISILSCPRLNTIPSYLKKSMTLIRFEIDEETSTGVKNMLADFREGIVLTVRYKGNRVYEQGNMSQAVWNIQPADAPCEGEHVLCGDANNDSGALGDETSVGAVSNDSLDDAGPLSAEDVNEGVLGTSHDMVAAAVDGSARNFDDVGDNIAPGILMDQRTRWNVSTKTRNLFLVLAVIAVLFPTILF